MIHHSNYPDDQDAVVGFGLGPDLIEFPIQQVLIGDARQLDHCGVRPGFPALLEFIQSINLDRHHQEKRKPPEAALTPEEKENKYLKDLEKDLSMYSD